MECQSRCSDTASNSHPSCAFLQEYKGQHESFPIRLEISLKELCQLNLFFFFACSVGFCFLYKSCQVLSVFFVCLFFQLKTHQCHISLNNQSKPRRGGAYYINPAAIVEEELILAVIDTLVTYNPTLKGYLQCYADYRVTYI